MIISLDLDLGLIGEEITCYVCFNYQPSEPQILNPVDKADPGAPEQFEIYRIAPNDTTIDLLPLFSETALERLTEQLREEYHANADTR